MDIHVSVTRMSASWMAEVGLWVSCRVPEVRDEFIKEWISGGME